MAEELSQTKQATNTDREKVPSRKRATILLALGGYVNTAIVIAQGLLMMPLYLDYIGAHRYGLWLASGGMLGMLGLVNFGMGSMVIQRIAHAYGRQDLTRAGNYFVNGIVVYSGICLLVALSGWLLSIYLPSILKLSEGDGELVRLCFLLALVAMTIAVFNECLRGFSQALLKPLVPMVAMAIGRIAGIALSIWMLFDDFGLWAIPAGSLLSEAFILIVNSFYSFVLFRKLNSNFFIDKKIIKEYLHTSPALLGARVGQTVAQESEPLLITIFLTPEITATYMIVRRAADVVFQLLNVVTGAMHSSFSHLGGAADVEKLNSVARRILLLYFVSSLIGFSTFIAANSAFVMLWVGESYVLSHEIILLIGISFFVRSLRGIIGQLLNSLGDFYYSSWVVLAEGVGRVWLIFISLTLVGIVAIPGALFVSCLFSLLILGFRLKRILSFKISLTTVARFFLSVLALLGIGEFMAPTVLYGVSWKIFSIYVLFFVGLLLFIFILINYRFCKVYIRGNE